MAKGIHEPVRDGALVWADDILDADRECGKRRQVHKVRCEACRRTTMVHCDECKIQVTGCLCTLVERMGPVEAYKVLARQVGQRQAQIEMRKYGHEMLWLPGLPD